MKKSTTAILVVIMLLLGAVIAYAVTQYASLPNDGIILAPASIEPTPTSVQWGSFFATDLPQSKTVRLTNIGDEPTLPLHMRIEWITPNTEFATITWNQEAQIIQPGGFVDAVFTIQPGSTYEGNFNFNIIIEGT